MLRKNCTGEMKEQDVMQEDSDTWIVSTGRCIIPNLNLVLEDAKYCLPSLKKLELLKVLNKTNELLGEVLLETNMRVYEENL